MKRILLTIIISLVFLVPFKPSCFAENGIPAGMETPEVSICPETKREDCTTCHVAPDNSLIEKRPGANRDFPYVADMSVTDEGKTANLFITTISADPVAKFFEYVAWHPEITKCVFEVMSPGGSMFQAWRIVGIMDMWKARGMKIETRVHGMCMSAGFLVWINGTTRLASPSATLMWHELMKFEMFKISRPADVEDEAVIMRGLQDTACVYLAERSKLTKKEWKDIVFKKEFWINGKQAIKYGISDGYPK